MQSSVGRQIQLESCVICIPSLLPVIRFQMHKVQSHLRSNTPLTSTLLRLPKYYTQHILDGCAVVLFAYGLSGSGKTYTVFGPDDPSIPDAWFNAPEPIANWGILPRLAYDLFGMQDQTWKFSLK